MTSTEFPQAVFEQFQGRLDALNQEQPPNLNAPPYLANIRHPCTAHRTTARVSKVSLALHEVYWTEEDGPHAFLFREGKCSRCGTVARSRLGRLVLAAERPPMYGRQGR